MYFVDMHIICLILHKAACEKAKGGSSLPVKDVTAVSVKKPAVTIKKDNKGPKQRPDAPLDKKVLAFSGTSYKAPKYFWKSTVYTDVGKGCWRLKLTQGDLHEKYYKWGGNARNVWKPLLISNAQEGVPTYLTCKFLRVSERGWV